MRRGWHTLPAMPFPTTEIYLARAETALGRRLPEPFRVRLLADNGGEIVVADEGFRLHPVFDETNRRTIARTVNHIVLETEEARRWHRFPPQAVALASGNADQLILFEWSDDVYFWDHETGEADLLDPDEVSRALSIRERPKMTRRE